ncbi:MAG: Sporulation protein YunB [Desulfotomaculum sp. 46_296]|nr:MAG: Sporulation protein YunB [Desulfotomaculum sp. 46_296]HAU30856.1 sporulation protein YunB [Desulfotomaculum sp.]
MFRRRRPFLLFLRWLLPFIILLVVVVCLDHLMRTTILKIAEIRATQLATEAINRTVQEEVWDNNLQYQDFVQVQKDDQGRIVFMQANTVRVTRMAADIVLITNRTLENLKGQTISVPLGQITGLYLFSYMGPRIRATIVPVGTIEVNVDDKFEPAGINQTRHKIWLNFKTRVKVVIPSMYAEASIATSVPLAESIIVGEVPSTFVNISGSLFGGGITR